MNINELGVNTTLRQKHYSRQKSPRIIWKFCLCHQQEVTNQIGLYALHVALLNRFQCFNATALLFGKIDTISPETKENSAMIQFVKKYFNHQWFVATALALFLEA